MSSRGGPSVPKFASFRKKPEAPPTSEKDDGHEGRRGSEIRGRHRERSRNQQDDSGSRSPRQVSDRHGLKSQETATDKCDMPRRPAPPQQTTNDLFTIDKRGDMLIRRYGSNDRYKIPAYRRVGAGRLLGSDSFFRIDRSGNREEFFLCGYGESGSTLGRDRKSLLSKASSKSSETVRVRVDTAQVFTGTEDYLPLGPAKKRKRGHSGTGSDGPDDKEPPSYRSIHGMSKHHEHSDSDEAFGSDSSVEVGLADVHNPVQQRSIKLTARVKNHPNDIDAWIELVEHQDVIRDLNLRDGRSATPAEVRSFAEIKLSMLEKALKYSHTSTRSADLRLRIMREGAKTWDLKSTDQRWDELLRDHGADFEIWKAYMVFKQSNMTTFRYEAIKQLYVDKLQNITKEMAENSSDSKKRLLYEQLLVVFSRLTHFLAEAGYTELAMAAWQAVLELHFHRPAILAHASPELALTSLQTFWESEVLRIGDDGAKGWAAYENTGGLEEPPEPRTYVTRDPPNTRDPYKVWASLESHKSEDARVPARTMDDGTEDDPYRVIMYADMQDILFFIPTNSLLMIQEQLIDAFVVFCQLPPVFGSSTPTLAVLRDQLINGGSSGRHIREIDVVVQRPDDDDDDGNIKAPRFDHHFPDMAKSSEVLFSSPQWFKYMGVGPNTHSTFISNILRQLTFACHNDELPTYFLSYASTYSTSSNKKLARALLKQNPSCTDLYLGYSRSEFFAGNREAARAVIPAALGLTDLTPLDRVRLCIAGAQMELEDGQFSEVLWRICQVPGDTQLEGSTLPVSPAQVLKTRQFLTGNRDHLLSSKDPNAAVIYAEALALLEYVTKTSGKESQSSRQGDIWSAISNIDACSRELVAREFGQSAAHERLLQSAALLLYYHSSRGPYRPAFFRETIASYIRLFPNNTIFLNLYSWREERLGIEDRVRKILDEVVFVNEYDTVSTRVFAIQHEMGAGNPHSTSAAFERAVENHACKHHAGIWISYIRYCHGKQELRSKAKAVFYRAVQSCPWSKQVYMEAFLTLVRVMDSSELKSVYNTLCDKGLRVHVELDEFVESWKRVQKQ